MSGHMVASTGDIKQDYIVVGVVASSVQFYAKSDEAARFRFN